MLHRKLARTGSADHENSRRRGRAAVLVSALVATSATGLLYAGAAHATALKGATSATESAGTFLVAHFTRDGQLSWLTDPSGTLITTQEARAIAVSSAVGQVALRSPADFCAPTS